MSELIVPSSSPAGAGFFFVKKKDVPYTPTRGLHLLRQRFWWPSMIRDARVFSACTICARGKSSHQPLVGLLQPLSIPRCPWSHIALDFIMGLPASEGNTVIMTVVDRFSRSAHFVPLPKLPLAVETLNLLA